MHNQLMTNQKFSMLSQHQKLFVGKFFESFFGLKRGISAFAAARVCTGQHALRIGPSIVVDQFYLTGRKTSPFMGRI